MHKATAGGNHVANLVANSLLAAFLVEQSAWGHFSPQLIRTEDCGPGLFGLWPGTRAGRIIIGWFAESGAAWVKRGLPQQYPPWPHGSRVGSGAPARAFCNQHAFQSAPGR